jgi:hypothetical protein
MNPIVHSDNTFMNQENEKKMTNSTCKKPNREHRYKSNIQIMEMT